MITVAEELGNDVILGGRGDDMSWSDRSPFP